MIRVKNNIKLMFYNIIWRKNNKHNHTYINEVTNLNNIVVGKGTYGKLNVLNDSNSKLVIGNYCSIANDVVFIVGGEHSIKHVSTYPFLYYIINEKELEATSKGNILINDDVWIGYRSIILSGVHIGQGAVIGAGSVVTKDIEPYSVVCGNPAKIIKYRFNDEIIKELLKIDYTKLNENDIKNHSNDLYKNIDNVKQIEWIINCTNK